MKKVLILGSMGMAGHMVERYLKGIDQYEIVTAARNSKECDYNLDIDFGNIKTLNELFETVKPDVVINCIGLLIRACDNDIKDALLINSALPHFLDDLCNKYKAKFIHISTDCVFSGNKGQYIEDDAPDAYNIYGRTKILGEVNNSNALTIRTSIIGPELKEKYTGLFEWFMHQKGQVNGWGKAYWSGVTTLELAKSLDILIQNDISGLYHLTSQKISKYDLLCTIGQVFNINVAVKKDESFSSDKSMVCTRNENLCHIRSHKIMLEELKEFMDVGN